MPSDFRSRSHGFWRLARQARRIGQAVPVLRHPRRLGFQIVSERQVQATVGTELC